MSDTPSAADPALDDATSGLAACEREPIHIPGSIQPHGLLLVAAADTQRVFAVAGDVEARFAADWLGRDLASLLGEDAGAIEAALTSGQAMLPPVAGRGESFDVRLHRTNLGIVVELEPGASIRVSAAEILADLERATARLERAPDIASLCDAAAKAFRRLTGYDRVMIYQFLDDEAGVVLAEDRDADVGSFLHHHFPAADIPKQARALYVRNRVRVIPDVGYVPAPLRPASAEVAALDMSDVDLRSVSPIHLQYLRNMGVGASASVSIVNDGRLWGLVACHNRTELHLSQEQRLACRMLASDLARQLRAKDEAALYRERIRLRSAEEAVVASFAIDRPTEDLLERHSGELRTALGADGFAIVSGAGVRHSGRVPDRAQVVSLAEWASPRAELRAYATNSLSAAFPPAEEIAALASGLLAVAVPGEDPLTLLWFRAEQIETVNWAGNPHKASTDDPEAQLTPRASFEAWSETVRGHSRAWSIAETETASRLARSVFEQRQHRRIRELNARLSATIVENERLLQHKDYLMQEVNHRVQNSLQLVASFLRLQGRTPGGEAAQVHLAEAERRVAAIALVHRQLHGGDTIEHIDLSRYFTDLCAEIANSMGEEWREAMQLDLAPVQTAANRAVQLGLILTELLLNAAKYAYDGHVGPVGIALDQQRNRLRLVVSDRGSGITGERQGFGTMMLNAMVRNLGGSIEYENNGPGLRTLITAPLIPT